jgi:cytochrome c551/c552
MAFYSQLLVADDGALLFNGNCITCHHPQKSISAPSMQEVRSRYQLAFSTKEEFVHYMTAFVINPSEEQSIMQDMIEKYELMPILGYEESVIEDIASYIYGEDFSYE